ncbi:MAG: DUF3891 family protein [Pirellulales bacterium]|nr:DUF3891 family protein [Pirellulales bacterium]
MIVTHTASGWDIVFQAAHALLAYRFAFELKGLKDIHLWKETLAALADHDDLKEAFGKNVYLTELGAPKDFTQFSVSARERFTEVKRRIESGHRKHRWIGVLCSRHAEELYAHENTSKQLKVLLQSERKRRLAVLHAIDASVSDLEAAYQVLQFCDRISLILCQGGIPAMNRRIEIVSHIGSARYELWDNGDHSLAVDPWPFETPEFEVGVEVRTIPQLMFSSDRELEKRLMASNVENRRWTFKNPK